MVIFREFHQNTCIILAKRKKYIFGTDIKTRRTENIPDDWKIVRKCRRYLHDTS